MANVVLIESFYGGSHRAWADAWVSHSRHEIALITHPDRFWRWRLRGGAVTLAEMFGEHVSRHGKPDAVVVSGMLDIAAFAGIARGSLDGVPIAAYMHESQLLYPQAPNQRPDISEALTNWRSMVAVDQVWFNSSFHQSALRVALPKLLGVQPEPRHEHLIDGVFDRSRVLWPGVETDALVMAGRNDTPGPPLILWNQRWDHDKNPQVVFSTLASLADEGLQFTVALAGQNHRAGSTEFDWIHDRLRGRIEDLGFQPPEHYRTLLLRSDVVVSAADHEFFGIAMVEAIAAGAVPVLPNRLSFPELIEPKWRPATIYEEGGLQATVRSVVGDLDSARVATGGLRESMQRFDVAHSAAAHDDAVDDLVGRSSRRG